MHDMIDGQRHALQCSVALLGSVEVLIALWVAGVVVMARQRHSHFASQATMHGSRNLPKRAAAHNAQTKRRIDGRAFSQAYDAPGFSTHWKVSMHSRHSRWIGFCGSYICHGKLRRASHECVPEPGIVASALSALRSLSGE